MSLDIKGGNGFSTPFTGSLYPAPPHNFIGATLAWATFETDADAVEALLPPNVKADSIPPIAELWVCDYPSTTFGPYLEAYLMIRVELDGVKYWYQPFIFTNREPALAAGREIWGYNKKLAHMEWREEAEQLIFTVERPIGKRLVTFTLTRDRLASSSEAQSLPILSLRFLPASDANRPPAAAELVRLDVSGDLEEAKGLGPIVWAGRASIAYDSPSEVDPWHRLCVGRILSGLVKTANFSLPLGTVVKDYVAEGMFGKRSEK